MLEKKKEHFVPTIGLELHVQLELKRKMFSPEEVTYGESPNTYTSPTTLAHPGTLPFPNLAALEAAIIMGLACGSQITRENHFARKNYNYADLPKGYQITQDKGPICVGGQIALYGAEGEKSIALERIHIEEDTGKSIHVEGKGITLLNFNRAGTPLIEVVTKPVLTNPQEIELCLMAIRRLVRYLGISNGNMEEGSLRCDVNVSLNMGTKVEVKNLNSARHAVLAAQYEIERQKQLLVSSNQVEAATRGYDPIRNVTTHQRKKEGKVDYRYFEDPNLSPFIITDAHMAKLRDRLPILPHVLYKKLITAYGLSDADAAIIMERKEIGLFFQSVVAHTQAYKIVANLIIGPLKSYLNQEKLTLAKINLQPQALAKLANLIAEDKVSFSVGSMQIFPLLLSNQEADPKEIAQEKGLLQVSDEKALVRWVEEVISAHPREVQSYKEGKQGLLGFLMGQVMRRSGRQANPKEATAILRAKLEEV